MVTYIRVTIVACCVAVFLMALGAADAQLESQPSPPVPAPNLPVADDQEIQVWQGRIIAVRGDDLSVKVEGEKETFDVASDAKIKKNRRAVELDAMVSGDFVTLKTIGKAGAEVAIAVSAFSLR